MSTITRREFNGAALAAMLLPAVKVSASIPAAPVPAVDWSLFCDSHCGEFSKYDLTRPFIRAGVKFASDSRIMLWQVTDDPDTVHEKRIPNAHYILENAMPDQPEWKPWPEPVYAFDPNNNNRACWSCNTGFADEKECECQSDPDIWQDIGGCEKCKYSGYVPGTIVCPACNGRPSGPAKNIIWLGHEKIDRRYDAKIRTLPGPIEWCYSDPSYETEIKHQTGGPILFRWAEGMGAVMPLAKD